MTMAIELLSCAPQLSAEVFQEHVESCRFCSCDEDHPCGIAIADDDAGFLRLARSEQETVEILACGWFLPGVCNRPECIEKLLAESRGRVLIYDAFGKPAA
jgi:hypothetical protein